MISTSQRLAFVLCVSSALLQGCGYVNWAGSLGNSTAPYHAYGSSITHGSTLAHPETQAYPALVATHEKVAFVNYGIPGTQACDVSGTEIFANADSPTVSRRAVYSLLVGTNDADRKGIGPYEPVFQMCHQAILSWLAIPVEYKVLATNSRVKTTGIGAIDSSNHWNSWTTAGQGSTVSFPITLIESGPIYAWPRISDINPATYSYSVDGVVLGTASTQTTPRIDTNSGGTDSLGFLRFPAVPRGEHLVTFTQTSAGTNGVSVVGIGTPAGITPEGRPHVLVGTLTYQYGTGQCNPASEEPCLTYTLIIESNAKMFSADGLEVRVFDTRKYMGGTAAEMNDALHPNVFGQTELAAAVEASW